MNKYSCIRNRSKTCIKNYPKLSIQNSIKCHLDKPAHLVYTHSGIDNPRILIHLLLNHTVDMDLCRLMQTRGKSMKEGELMAAKVN